MGLFRQLSTVDSGDGFFTRPERAHAAADGATDKGPRALALDMESKGTHPLCPAVEAIRLVGTEWRLGIVRVLMLQPMRFSDIERVLDGVDPKSLARVLHALEETGIVERVSQADGRRAYALTEKGRALEPVVDALAAWGRDWIVMPQPTSSAR